MVFKPSKESVLYIIILFSSCSISFIIIGLYYSNKRNLWWGILVLCVFFAICAFKLLMIYGSTLTMDENGCTLDFLWIRKKYLWSDLKTIRVEDLRATIYATHDSSGYEKCIVFSTKARIKPFIYATPNFRYDFFGTHFKTFFVYFVKYNKDGKRNDNGTLWSCEEEEMLAKLKEWGIEPEFRVYNY